jgi:hypothetical protein
MATYTINATSNGGYINATGSNYSNTRGSGSSGKTAYTNLGYGLAGQGRVSGPNYFLYEGFLEFDTSVLSGKTITSATLKIYPTDLQQSNTFTIEARLRDFGATFEKADWVAGDDLAALTLLATLTSASAGTGAYRSFTDVAMVANLNTAGKTRMVLATDRFRTATQPVNGPPYELVQWDAPSNASVPQLVVVTAESTGTLTSTIAAITLSAAIGIETFGAVDAGIGTITLSASGEGAAAQSGVLNQSIGAITLSSDIGIETFGYLDVSIGTITLSTAAALPVNGTLSTSIGNLTLASIGARDTTGSLSTSIGNITLATSTSSAINGALTASIGEIMLTAVQSDTRWPTVYSFPQAPLDGTWRRTPADETLRSDRGIGARQYRSRQSNNYSDATFSIMLKTAAQRAELYRFFEVDCASGSKPYLWADPETGDVVKWTWSEPPLLVHLALDNYRVECAVRREAA